MISFLHQLADRLWGISKIKERQSTLNQRQVLLDQQQTVIDQRKAQLDQQQTVLDQRQTVLDQEHRELRIQQRRLGVLSDDLRQFAHDSIDQSPWNHPYLAATNLIRFREYSESIWKIALDYHQNHFKPLRIAFVTNMAQNMYKWSQMIQRQGGLVTLFLNPLDKTALSRPEWEEFDGEYTDVLDGEGFLKANPDIRVLTPVATVPMEGAELFTLYSEFIRGRRKPLLCLLAQATGIRHEVLLNYEGYYPYFQAAKALAEYHVSYAASLPLGAYASGRPYCAFSVGGDLQFDCGRGDDYGRVHSLSFNAARFLCFTNPHTLAHCRRLGFTNGLYLPYPMDDGRYCPGEGQARRAWEALYGPGVYILIACRIDKKVKGQDEEFFQTLVNVAKQRPQVHFIFLAWGDDAGELAGWIRSSGLPKQFILLKPAGKKRMIDYYRSCDVVLDQFIYGYHGATGLEAAAIGKPVVIRLRTEHYEPWYKGDYMPAQNAATREEIYRVLITLIDSPDLRLHNGMEMRKWLVRNHGEARTAPLLLALLRLAADRVPLPSDLVNPLSDQETEEEQAYHRACQQPVT
jgi:glycosyltransferase involved in cell wall biosynthesis